MTTVTKPIRHLAGPHNEGWQECTRCARVIADNRHKDAVKAGMVDNFGLFAEGPVIEHGEKHAGIWRTRLWTAGDEPEAVDCERTTLRYCDCSLLQQGYLCYCGGGVETPITNCEACDGKGVHESTPEERADEQYSPHRTGAMGANDVGSKCVPCDGRGFFVTGVHR